MSVTEIDSIDLESAFLVLLMVFSGIILYGSFSFSSTARVYPFFTSVAVIILSLAILIRKHIPENIKDNYWPNIDILNSDTAQDIAEDEVDDAAEDEVNERSVLYMMLIFGGYLISVIVFGFLISSVLITYTIQQYFGYKRNIHRITVAISMGIFTAIGYMIFQIPFDQGMVLNLL